jgi:integrase
MKNPDIELFRFKLAKATRPSDLTRLCKNEFARIETKYPNVTTKRSTVTSYRNVIREVLGERLSKDALDKLLEIVKVSKAEQDAYKESAKEKLTDRLNTLGDRAIDPDKVIEIAQELILTDSYLKISVGLALLTGRRSIEILRAGKFFALEDETQAIAYAESLPGVRVSDSETIQKELYLNQADESVLFVGQAKTRNSEQACKQPYPIPTLCLAEEAIAALNKIRALKPEFLTFELTAEQIAKGKSHEDILNGRVSKEQNLLVKKFFKGILPDDHLSIKELRSAYSMLCHTCFNPRTSLDSYSARILGHSDVSTALNYQKFRVD